MPDSPTLPLIAYAVREGASATDDGARTIATCRTAAGADYLVRALESLRVAGLLFGPDHDGLTTFAAPVEREATVAGSVADAIQAGYVVRAVVVGAGAGGADAAVELPGLLPQVVQQAARRAALPAPAAPSSGRPPDVRGLQ